MIIVRIPGQQAIFVSCDAEIHKAASEERIEEDLLPDRQYTVEKISKEGEIGSWQVYSFPKSALPRIKQTEDGSSTTFPVYPLQAALRSGLGISFPFLYLYASGGTIGMTAIVGKEVSSVSLLSQDHLLLQSVASALNDYKAVYHLPALRVLTNDEVIAKTLQSLKAEVLQPALSKVGIPSFLFPEQVFIARAAARRRELLYTAGIVGLLTSGVWGFYFSSTAAIRALEAQKSRLSVEVQATQQKLAAAKESDLNTLFPEEEKVQILAFLARCNHLPFGYDLGAVKIEKKEGLTTAEVIIKTSLLGMPAAPIKQLFPDGKITPQFQKDGQGYLVSCTFKGGTP